MLSFLLFLNSLLLLIVVVVAGGGLFFVFKDRMPEKARKSSVKALRKKALKTIASLEKAIEKMEEEDLTALSKQLEILLEEHEKKGGESDD